MKQFFFFFFVFVFVFVSVSFFFFFFLILHHGGPADPFGGTPGGTPKRGTPQGRVPHRVGSAGGTPSRGLHHAG